MEDPVKKYFKKGDIVVDFPGSIWGNKKFVVEGFHGNWYCPCASVLEFGKPDSNKYRCNFDTRNMRLVDAAKRPMKNLDKRVIAKMMKNGVVEAKREFLIRVNTKKTL